MPGWAYGVNDHCICPHELPASLAPTGIICIDYPKLCRFVDAIPHPALRPRQSLQHNRRSHRLNPVIDQGEGETKEPESEDSVLTFRSILVDRISLQLVNLLLPMARFVKALRFSDCHLDAEMLRLLQQGLKDAPGVESLQIEWNPIEVPLPPAEVVSEAIMEEPTPKSNVTNGYVAREQQRYLQQSQRTFHAFRERIACLFGDSLEKVWVTLEAAVPMDKPLICGAFYDLLEKHLGVMGPQVEEVFNVLSNLEDVTGYGKTSFAALKQSLENTPDELDMGGENSDTHNDPIGSVFAAFLNGDCLLESVSLRACSVGHLELKTMAKALVKCPWQLRCLNLWDNRICDPGVQTLAAALDEYRGLEYLGLGRNFITAIGLASICRVFNAELLDAVTGAEPLERRNKKEAEAAAAAKAKAKAKPAKPAKVETPPPEVIQRPDGTTRRIRVAPDVPEETLEDIIPAEATGGPVYLLKRPCELRTLSLKENPIVDAAAVMTVQPLGPAGAELLLRGTEAAATILARMPEPASKAVSQRGQPPQSALAAKAGWILRLS